MTAQPSGSIVVFHGHCADGAAAAVVARRVKRHTDLVVGQHEKIDEQVREAARRIKPGGMLFIVDILCSKACLEEVAALLAERGAALHVYEHHATNAWLSGFRLGGGQAGEIVFDDARCGSRIFFEAWQERQPRLADLADFIRLIDDRDMWANRFPESADLALLHNLWGDERFINRFLKDATVTLTEAERVLLDHEKENLARRQHRLMKDIRIQVDAAGLRYGVMVGEGKASEVCNEALRRFDLDYVCLLDFNNARASIRSRDGKFDCAAFSKGRGGGGHPCAAGFPLPPVPYSLHG